MFTTGCHGHLTELAKNYICEINDLNSKNLKETLSHYTSQCLTIFTGRICRVSHKGYHTTLDSTSLGEVLVSNLSVEVSSESLMSASDSTASKPSCSFKGEPVST